MALTTIDIAIIIFVAVFIKFIFKWLDRVLLVLLIAKIGQAIKGRAKDMIGGSKDE